MSKLLHRLVHAPEEASEPAFPRALVRQIRTARDLADRRRREPTEGSFPTTCQAFDHLLAGGLRRGQMVELIGRRSSGRFSLTAMALAAATRSGEAAALIDLGDGFDPRTAEAFGVDLERLLWVRPRHLKEVLTSAEVVLTSGIPLVVLELGMPPLRGGRGAEASWLRLARRAIVQRTALLVSSPYRVTGTAAQRVIQARDGSSRWHGRGASPRLLTGVSSTLELLKSRARELTPRQGDREAIALRIEDIPGTESRSPTPTETPATGAPAPVETARRAIA